MGRPKSEINIGNLVCVFEAFQERIVTVKIFKLPFYSYVGGRWSIDLPMRFRRDCSTPSSIVMG